MKLKVKLVSIFAKCAKEDEDGLTRIEGPATVRGLAEYLGDRDGAQRFRRAAGRPVARASGCRPLPAVVR